MLAEAALTTERSCRVADVAHQCTENGQDLLPFGYLENQVGILRDVDEEVGAREADCHRTDNIGRRSGAEVRSEGSRTQRATETTIGATSITEYNHLGWLTPALVQLLEAITHTAANKRPPRAQIPHIFKVEQEVFSITPNSSNRPVAKSVLCSGEMGTGVCADDGNNNGQEVQLQFKISPSQLPTPINREANVRITSIGSAHLPDGTGNGCIATWQISKGCIADDPSELSQAFFAELGLGAGYEEQSHEKEKDVAGFHFVRLSGGTSASLQIHLRCAGS